MNYTYKLLWTWEVKQLYHSKVIACGNVKAWVWHAGTGDICFVCVAGPDPHNLIPKDTGHRQRQRDRDITFCWRWLANIHLSVQTVLPSPCPGGPGNPVDMGLFCHLLPGRHFIHESFISTCWYLMEPLEVLGTTKGKHNVLPQSCRALPQSVPGRKRCLRRSPSASQSWGCPGSSWHGSAAGQASGRRSQRHSP